MDLQQLWPCLKVGRSLPCVLHLPRSHLVRQVSISKHGKSQKLREWKMFCFETEDKDQENKDKNKENDDKDKGNKDKVKS